MSSTTPPSTPPPPATMRAAQIARFGPIDDVLTVTDGVPRPSLPRPSTGKLLLSVHAVSLSPSDYRMSTGDTSLVKKPPSWPYIPGGDVSGVVEAVGDAVSNFAVGDRVIATWDMFGMGGIAQYTVVDAKFAIRAPEQASWVQAAAMADSASNAMLAVEDAEVRPGDRVLILGGSGSVGTVAVQFARNKGAAFVAATSTDAELVTRLGAHQVLNYREHDWWLEPAWRNAPFDVIIDCAEGVTAWQRACASGVLKSGRQGGRFVAVVLNEWDIHIKTSLGMIRWFAPVLARTALSRLLPGRPKYIMMMPAPRGDSLERCIKEIEDGKVEVVVDKRCPLPFTTAGVREAFNIMINRSGHGKIVIQIRDD